VNGATEINLDWTANLYEVGAPIRDGVREIHWRIEQADARLEAEKRLHADSMAEIKRAAELIEREVAKLWTPEEIAAAKRGVMLAGGVECVL
jgi:hypothetical protein